MTRQAISSHQLTVLIFTVTLLPVAIIGVVANIAVVYYGWRQEFQRPEQHDAPFTPPSEVAMLIPDRYLMTKTLLITGVLLGTFLLGWPRDVCALGAAAIMLCSRRTPAARLYALVDWNLIMLFVALFVVIGALQHQGLMAQALARLADYGVMLSLPSGYV